MFSPKEARILFWLMTIAIIVMIGCIVALTSVGVANAAPSCQARREAAQQYRLSTWRYEDGLQEGRTTAGYVAGRRTSCSNARQVRKNWETRAARRWRLLSRYNGDIPAAIMHYFGPDVGPGAIVVAHCESGTNLTHDEIPTALSAGNGWYRGIFQLGVSPYWEVNKYGLWRGVLRYETVIDQVAAAARMYFDRGWSAWACRPDGSVAY